MIERICNFIIDNATIVASVVAMTILFYTGFADGRSFVDGNQVAKREFFAVVALVVFGVAMLLTYKSRLHLSVIDLLVFLFVGYTTLTFFALDSLAHTRQLVIWLLGALYFNLRIILASDKRMTTVIVIIILASGALQAVVGLRQIFITGFSNHSLYKITGTFFNPGPYGGYVAVIATIGVALVFSLYQTANTKPLKSNGDIVMFFGALMAVFLTLLVLPASMSRTAWVAFVGGVFVVIIARFKVVKWIKGHKYFSAIALVVLFVASWGAYMLKQDSFVGRGVTWKIGLMATTINPIVGSGTGHFAESFAQAQSEYFVTHPFDATVAGSPEYGFNEYIQIIIEYGYIGFLIVILAIFIAIKNLLNGGRLEFAVGIGLLAMCIFAFASYPFSLLPFLILLVIMLALGAQNTKGLQVGLSFRVMLVLLAGLLSVYCYTKIDSKPYREWYGLQMSYNNKAYASVVEGYGELYPTLKDNPKFLFEYGHTLGFCGKHSQAIQVLERGARMNCDPMFYNIIGNNHKALGDNALAAQSYERAYAILPGRIYPLYLLVKLYHESGQSDSAIIHARRLLDHPDKVPSPATRDMRKEVADIYDKLTR